MSTHQFLSKLTTIFSLYTSKVDPLSETIQSAWKIPYVVIENRYIPLSNKDRDAIAALVETLLVIDGYRLPEIKVNWQDRRKLNFMGLSSKNFAPLVV